MTPNMERIFNIITEINRTTTIKEITFIANERRQAQGMRKLSWTQVAKTVILLKNKKMVSIIEPRRVTMCSRVSLITYGG